MVLLRVNYFHIIILSLAVFSGQLQAQTFKGSVVDLENLPLPNAAAQWEGTNIGVMADDSGHFEMALPPDTSLALYRIKITFGGATEVYEIDDLFSEWIFTMAVLVELQEVNVYDAATGAYISRLQPIKTEIINSNELRKAACCDLAGCFETQSTVQPQVTNVLTNAKEQVSGIFRQTIDIEIIIRQPDLHLPPQGSNQFGLKSIRN